MKRIVLCPCKSGQLYKDCCQKYHLGSTAENALLLMRSRFSAYALGLADYIIKTTHLLNPSYNLDSKQWEKEIRNQYFHTRFENLEIIEFLEKDQEAFVTFTAYLLQKKQDVSFTERSYFLFSQGKWLYRSGEISNPDA